MSRDDGRGDLPAGLWVSAEWWKRRQRRQLGAYISFVAACCGAVYGFVRFNEQQCEDRRGGRTALRAVIIRSYESGQPIDLTTVPGFIDIEDPAVRETLQALVSGVAGPNRDAARDEVLSLAPPIEC